TLTDAAGELPLRDRRTVLQAGVLGLLALVAASVAAPLRWSGPRVATLDESADGSREPNGRSAPPGVAPSPAASTTPRMVVAHISEVATTGARAFTVPFTAPSPLPAGDPAVIVALSDGTYVAFDAVC